MAKEGASVVVTDIDLSAAQIVANEIVGSGAKAEAAELDFTNEDAWKKTIEKVMTDHQRLDILVNNAGISISKPIAQSTFDDWRKVLSINLDGVFLGAKYAIDAMKNGGSIVNMASVSGISPSAGAAAYCASKAAVHMFSKTVSIECTDANSGIRVNVVTPAGVKTPMWEKEEFFQALIDEHGGTEKAFAAMAGDTRSHQFFSPDEIAETILYLASDESAHLTGTEIVLDRGHTG